MAATRRRRACRLIVELAVSTAVAATIATVSPTAVAPAAAPRTVSAAARGRRRHTAPFQRCRHARACTRTAASFRGYRSRRQAWAGARGGLPAKPTVASRRAQPRNPGQYDGGTRLPSKNSRERRHARFVASLPSLRPKLTISSHRLGRRIAAVWRPARRREGNTHGRRLVPTVGRWRRQREGDDNTSQGP